MPSTVVHSCSSSSLLSAKLAGRVNACRCAHRRSRCRSPVAITARKQVARARAVKPEQEGSDRLFPGDLGWDPFQLRNRNRPVFDRIREIEVIHARWAMLGILALILLDVAGHPLNPRDPSLESILPLGAAVVLVYGFIESYRLAYLWNEKSYDKRTYPGKQFDFLGFTKSKAQGPPPGLGVFASWIGGPLGWLAGGWWFQQQDLTLQGLEDMKARELKNGRLAMISFLGAASASLATGKGPMTLLMEHLSDPVHHTIVQNLSQQ